MGLGYDWQIEDLSRLRCDPQPGNAREVIQLRETPARADTIIPPGIMSTALKPPPRLQPGARWIELLCLFHNFSSFTLLKSTEKGHSFSICDLDSNILHRNFWDNHCLSVQVLFTNQQTINQWMEKMEQMNPWWKQSKSSTSSNYNSKILLECTSHIKQQPQETFHLV